MDVLQGKSQSTETRDGEISYHILTCSLLLHRVYTVLPEREVDAPRSTVLLLAACYLLVAACYLLLAACYLLLVTCYLLLATCCLLLAACYLLLAACLLLLAASHLPSLFTCPSPPIWRRCILSVVQNSKQGATVCLVVAEDYLSMLFSQCSQ